MHHTVKDLCFLRSIQFTIILVLVENIIKTVNYLVRPITRATRCQKALALNYPKPKKVESARFKRRGSVADRCNGLDGLTPNHKRAEIGPGIR